MSEHTQLDERGEVVPPTASRPMPSPPPLALSYAVKLSGSNRARYWYLNLPLRVTSYLLEVPLPPRGGIYFDPVQVLSLVLTPDFGMSVSIIRARHTYCYCARMRRGVSFVDNMTCQAATGAANGPCPT